MRKSIKASEGKILTNGEIYGTVIYLAEGISPNTFYEIPLTEYEQLMSVNLEESEETQN